MKKWASFGLVFVAVLSFFPALSASALGLKVAPLEYKATLKEGEKQQGFIDISNPSVQPMAVKISVQAFRQIDDDGGLQFYDDKQVAAGIKPDIQTIDLGNRQAARVFFTIDGANLPDGDIFAAIFFTTEPKQPTNGVGQLVRVGTILSLVNKNPVERKAEVTKLSLPFIQLSDTVKGTYSVKNIGRQDSGFYPVVNISSWPSSKPKQQESTLVFGGRERENDFSYQTGIGVHSVEVGFGESKKSQWVVTVSPWMLVVFLLAVVIIGIELLLFKKRRKSRQKLTSNTVPSTPEK